jgi:hypothetical protein
VTARANIYRTRRNPDGNTERIEGSHGSYSSIAEAQRHAEALGHYYCPAGIFHWEQFSPTTWGLMSGQCHIHIVVSWLDN